MWARSAEPAATATHSPTPTTTPLSTATLTPTSLPLLTAPSTSTPAPPDPEIIAFGVSPAEAEPGDTVVLTWQARGTQATICPTARFVLFTGEDCRQVPLEGTMTFTIPLEAAGFQRVDLVLRIEGTAPTAAVTGQAAVALKCDETWFYSDEPQAGICPL